MDPKVARKRKSAKTEEQAAVFDIDLDRLPIPVAHHICIFLSASDAISLSKTCRFWNQTISSNSVWKKMVEHRYGYQAIINAEQNRLAERSTASPDEANTVVTAATASSDDCVNYKALYFDLKVTRVSVLDLFVTWLNDDYLTKEEEDSSPFKHVVHLCYVCWLDIAGTVKNVLPGRYQLVWRLKLERVDMAGQTEFLAEPESGNEVIKMISESEWRKLEHSKGRNRWFMMEMGTFTVRKMCGVKLLVSNKSPHWKSGLWWDYAELRYI